MADITVFAGGHVIGKLAYGIHPVVTTRTVVRYQGVCAVERVESIVVEGTRCPALLGVAGGTVG